MANDVEESAPTGDSTGDDSQPSADDAEKTKRSLPIPGSPSSRRGFLIGALAGGVVLTVGKKFVFGGGGGEAAPLHNFTQDIKEWTPSKALDALKRGNSRFVRMAAVDPNVNAEHRTALGAGQSPFAAIVGCVDSRVPPELVFDRGLGDLFVARVAGNIPDDTIVGSIEFGVDEFNIPLVLVLGHTSCGAVTAAMAAAGHAPQDAHADETAHGAEDDTVHEAEDAGHSEPATEADHTETEAVVEAEHATATSPAEAGHGDDSEAADAGHGDSGQGAELVPAEAARAFATALAEGDNEIGSIVEALLPATVEATSVDDAVRINVRRTVEAFKQSHLIATRIEFGVLQVVGAVYDTATGVVTFDV